MTQSYDGVRNEYTSQASEIATEKHPLLANDFSSHLWLTKKQQQQHNWKCKLLKIKGNINK